jgi:hypothetical protein
MKYYATALLAAAALCTTCGAQVRGSVQSDDEDGGIYSRTIIHPDESRTQDKRDINNKILEKRTLDKNGVLLMKSLFQLNASGKAINGLVYDGRNRLLYRSEFVYDSADRLQEERIFEPDGTPVRRLVYKADSSGNMKPSFAFSYVEGKAIAATSSEELESYSSNSSHAYRGGGSPDVAKTATAYRPSASSNSGGNASSGKKSERRFRIFKRKRSR